TGNATIAPATGLTVTTGALSATNTQSLTVNGAGTVTFGAASPSFAAGAGLTLTAGTVNVNNATALGTGANVTVNSGIFNLGTGVSATLASLSGTGGTVALNGNTLTLGATSGSYAGVITDGTGPGALVKSGAGTQTLSGPNTFTGGITVSAGKLALT